MIGKSGAQLDRDQLEAFCEARKLQALQSRRMARREQINLALEKIEVSAAFPAAESRPFGVDREDPTNQAWFWRLILDHVTEPQEIIKLSQVSTMFRELLKQKYLETRLPEIVTLILDKRWNYLKKSSEDIQAQALVSPSLYDMRQLSRQCKRSMEEIATSSKGYLFLLIHSIAKLRKVSQDLLMNPSHGATFYLRYIFLSLEGEDTYREEVKLGMKIILETIGAQIHGFIYISYLDSPRQIYGNLREWAGMMPNLQSLKLCPMQDLRLEVQAPIETFPKMEFLQIFEETSRVLPVKFTQSILEASLGIRELWLEENEVLRNHSIELLRTLENLTSLHISPSRQLLQERNLPWKLNKIILDRENSGALRREERCSKTTTSSSRVFSFLKQFKDTLEHVEIMIDIFDCSDFCGYLELTNLKTIKWRYHDSFDNVNFLLYCGKLEKIKVAIGRTFLENTTPREEYNRIVSSSFLGKEIWDVFPCLEHVRIAEAEYVFGDNLLEERRTTP